MDNNTNTPPAPETPGNATPAAPAAPTPPSTATPSSATPSSDTPKKSSNKALVMVIAAFAILIILAIVFIILGRNVFQTNAPEVVVPAETEPTATPILIPTATSSPESVDALDVGDPTSDLNTIEQDASQL